jgi:Glu-tRNA(Gln) amidotransferase subunit E-like FAD-binding protein
MSEDRIEIKAIKYAKEMYRQIGWTVTNVTRAGGAHTGYDLHLERGSEKLRVEVKGCSRLYQIPDLYSSEIDKETLRLIADELCVVYFTGTDDS